MSETVRSRNPMRVLFDIAHPAHVHFFRHIDAGLRARGHQTAVVARAKDVTLALLREYGIPHLAVGRPSRAGRVGQLFELLHRDLYLARVARRFGADVICTRNPAGVQAARLCGAIGVFDTDDGSAVGIHWKAARPFFHYMTSPDCLPEDWGRRHIRYPGYKQSAYLHPDHFKPDPGILADLGIAPGDRVYLVRLVAFDASHDARESGMPASLAERVIHELERHGRVILSCEKAVPDRWRHLAFRLPPHRLHDLLAFTTLVVGDSQTVQAEAAVLGTPALRVSSFAGRVSYLEELEHRYGLAWSFKPAQSAEFLARLNELLARGDRLRESVAAGHARMLKDKQNIATWYVDFLERIGPRP